MQDRQATLRLIWGLCSLIFLSSCGPLLGEKDNLKERWRQKQRQQQRARLHQEQIQSRLAALVAPLPEHHPQRHHLEEQMRQKRQMRTVVAQNLHILTQSTAVASALEQQTALYHFIGNYKVLVIPVEFTDVKFSDRNFYGQQLQNYLFGADPSTLSTYYRHVSLGKFHLSGEVTPIISVSKKMADYGEAISQESDKDARGLVVEALQLLLNDPQHTPQWWSEFDQWDLFDYDFDGNYYEPDGFIDAVVVLVAGKDQASCQRTFDPLNLKPASAAVPAGPRQKAAIHCFNRLWPHRWSLSLEENHPSYSKEGPVVEGLQRESFGGLKINSSLFAIDYNLQSEYSDRSTFIHEFGHSLALPDLYSSGKDENSTGEWEIMGRNAHNSAQEMSSYSKMILGWLSPKVVGPGENFSAYLGAYNFVSHQEREKNANFAGPYLFEEHSGQRTNIVSLTPQFGEPVYRSLLVENHSQRGKVHVVDIPPSSSSGQPTFDLGHWSAYSGRFDGQEKALTLRLLVPLEGEGSALLQLDTIYTLETETNFNSNDEKVQVAVEYDLGFVRINGKEIDRWHLSSGDADSDSLVEQNPLCASARLLQLRLKKIRDRLTLSERVEWEEKLPICQKPIWVHKSYNLEAWRGQEVQLQIAVRTDAGNSEMGVVVDNIRLGQTLVDFENLPADRLKDFLPLEDGDLWQQYHQFYLMEYRHPQETFSYKGKMASLNMDRNIMVGDQAMFLPPQQESVGSRSSDNNSDSLQERFRLITYQYRPGVVVWYFNSKFNSIENDAFMQGGKGHFLLLNSSVGEVPLPGILSADPALFDEKGIYQVDGNTYRELDREQERLFTCFSHRQYAQEQNGVAPDCSGVEEGDLDYMAQLFLPRPPANTLSPLVFVEKTPWRLQYRRRNINEVLPLRRLRDYTLDKPLWSYPSMRVGLAPFSPVEDGEFAPFTVYKVQGQGGRQTLVRDEMLTAQAKKFPPIWQFYDGDNQLPTATRLQGDTVVVEKDGLHFKVVSPGERQSAGYSAQASPDSNESYLRRPRVKIYFEWDN